MDILRTPNPSAKVELRKFGQLIKQMRQECGLSQDALAKKMGVNPSMLSHWEADKRRIKADQLFQIADICSMTLMLQPSVYDHD